MKAVNKYINKLLICSLVLSCLFVAGIPMIILGATHGQYAIMGVGIGLTVIGFYGAPIAWVSYGNARGLKRIVYAVVVENLYTVQEIAAQISQSEKYVRSKLTICFNRNFLAGFKREGDNIVLNENAAVDQKQRFAECPYCGAKFAYSPQNPRCPYCNSPVVTK